VVVYAVTVFEHVPHPQLLAAAALLWLLALAGMTMMVTSGTGYQLLLPALPFAAAFTSRSV